MPPNEIQRAGLNAVLTKSLSIKGEGAPSSVLGAEVVPVLALEADRKEWSFLSGEIRASAVALLGPAGAGATNRLQLRNELSSGVIVVVEQIVVSAGATTMVIDVRVSAQLTQAAFVNPLPPIALDLRAASPTNTAPVGVGFFQDVVNADPTSSARIAAVQVEAAAHPQWEVLQGAAVILPPGSQLFIRALTLNTPLNAYILFRARPVEQGELV